jgi:crotonobetainyl-CoA:carnitine CoA-transferase CaiB-like acyl-CoA transferase
LCGVLKSEAVASPDFATAAARKQHEDRLDAIVEAWTSERTAAEVVATLQAAGVAAARMQTGATLAHDPHVAAREAYVPITHPRLGKLRVVRPPWRMRGAELTDPAPLLGQHNDYVLGEVLGLGQEEIERLIASEIVY